MERLSTGLAIVAAFAALSFGAIANVAIAGHYHSTGQGNAHGMVHGSSTTDSNWHARVEAGPYYSSTWCVATQWNTSIRGGWTSAGATCNVFMQNYGPECVGGAAVEQSGAGGVGWHRHFAHNRCW